MFTGKTGAFILFTFNLHLSTMMLNNGFDDDQSQARTFRRLKRSAGNKVVYEDCKKNGFQEEISFHYLHLVLLSIHAQCHGSWLDLYNYI